MASVPSETILLGCVAENNHKYLSQALRLVQSVRWFGGAFRGVDIVVAVVEGVEPAYRRALESLGAEVRVVSRFDTANPLFNKIQAFKLPGLERYDTLFYLDCDTIVAQDPSPFLARSAMQAKIADIPSVPTEVLERLCGRFGLKAPARRYRTTFDRAPTVWYCNAGVVACPVRFISRIIPAWCGYELEFSANPDLLGPHQHHRSQAALALAFIANPVPFEEMPVAMNFPLHLTHMKTPVELAETDPVILHYHHLVDEGGYLLPSPYPLAQRRIEAFNRRLRALASTGNIPGVSEIKDAPAADVFATGRAEEFVDSLAGSAYSRFECVTSEVIQNPSADLRDSSLKAGSAEPLVVCVAGMHRSGTSMFARMLHLCGVHMGAEANFLPPNPENEEGFWENSDFVNLNDALLCELGGSWHKPPSDPDKWNGADMEVFRQRGRKLVRRLRGLKVWGWKDPRNSLTLPFWRQLIPGLKVVVCLRNPLEVIQSLGLRETSVDDSQVELWLLYNRRLRAAAPTEDRVITDYSAYFSDPAAELRRVLDILGVRASDEAIEGACATVLPQLRHHQVSLEELTETGIPDDVVEEYLSMCSEAGPLLETRTRSTRRAGIQRRDYRDMVRLKQLEAAIQRTEMLLHRRELEMASLREMENRAQDIESLKAELRARGVMMASDIRLRDIPKAVKRRVIKRAIGPRQPANK